jgi:hypothetical protein
MERAKRCYSLCRFCKRTNLPCGRIGPEKGCQQCFDQGVIYRLGNRRVGGGFLPLLYPVSPNPSGRSNDGQEQPTPTVKLHILVDDDKDFIHKFR